MPEEKSADLIGRSLHVEHDSDALLFSRISLFKLQHDRTGKVLVSQIFRLIILTDIHHSPEIFDQRAVRIICRRLVKESPAVCIGIEHDLDRIDYSGFSASRMSGKEVYTLIEAKYFSVNIMPVIQTDLR